MRDAILTTATMKKITSSKGTEIVIVIPSSVSLDALKDLKNRDEFFIALGTSQMDVTDYLGEPRKGLLIKADASGVVQSVTNSEETEEEQIDIDQIEETEAENEEAEQQEDSEDDGEERDQDDESSTEDQEQDTSEDEQENNDAEVTDDDKPRMPGDDEDLPY